MRDISSLNFVEVAIKIYLDVILIALIVAQEQEGSVVSFGDQTDGLGQIFFVEWRYAPR